jgi:hypothetical protein
MEGRPVIGVIGYSALGLAFGLAAASALRERWRNRRW